MPSRWSDATRRTQDGVNGGVWSVKQLADLVQGIASFPAIPHQGLLSLSASIRGLCFVPTLLAPVAVIVLH